MTEDELMIHEYNLKRNQLLEKQLDLIITRLEHISTGVATLLGAYLGQIMDEDQAKEIIRNVYSKGE